MQRAMAVVLAGVTVQAVAVSAAGHELYADWWWMAPAPALLIAMLSATVFCARGRFTSAWCLAWCLVLAIGGVLVAWALTPTLSVASACSPIFGPACAVVGLLHAPRVALTGGLLFSVPPNVVLAAVRPEHLGNILSFTLFLIASLFAAVVGRRLCLRLAAVEERELALLDAAILEDRVANATWDARRESEREMHDHVVNTLTALGHGSLDDSPVWRARCADDANFVRAYTATGVSVVSTSSSLLENLTELATEFGNGGLTVQMRVHDNGSIAGFQPPDVVIDRLKGAVREALNNVRSYSGAGEGIVDVSYGNGVVEVAIIDHGWGIADAIDDRGDGIRFSIIGRMEDVGGSAQVESVDPHGTRVRLLWPR
jgi:glucose-6-phosphate-specific signal transduction histidine kinase